MSNCHLNLPPVEFTLKQGEAYYQSDYRLLLIVAVVSYLAQKSVHLVVRLGAPGNVALQWAAASLLACQLK